MRRDGLVKLDAAFVAHLQAADVALHNRLMTARRDPAALERKAESDLLVDVAPHLEDFIADLFGIAPELRALQARHDALAPIYTVKRLFVQRRAVKGMTPETAAAIDGEALARELEAQLRRAAHRSIASRAMSRAGSTPRPSMRRRSSSPRATPPGRRCRRRDGASIAAACCSRCRTSST